MDGYWLRGKKMPMASMQEVSLRGSNLVFTDLSGAFLRGADLSEGENGTRTDLRSASLYWADLTDVVAGRASFFGVDLRRAILCGVDLREADLRYADLREAAVNETPTPQGETCGSNPAFLPPPEGSDGTCWPTDTPEDPLCGDEARQMLCQRGSVVAQLPAVRPCEG
ncbi:pentapeptide repeat-containing protein [Arthrobacter sp. 260]|nr:pentapeptide repeat-containing protein [Arthrobacter sp. 260]